MTDLRTAAQQVLEALGHVVRQAQENLVPTIHYGPVHDVMNNLRAALAQEQAEPVVGWMDPESEDVVSAAQRAVWAQDFGVAGRRKAGRFTIPLRACLAQEQAEPEGSVCARCGALAFDPVVQQAEPLNLLDRAVQRRLAAQWGYVPAEQAEPVAGVVLNDEGRAALVEHGTEDWHCALRNARRLYTAPPRRMMVPLAEAEIERLIYENTKINPNLADDRELLGYIVNAARAVERAHGIKE